LSYFFEYADQLFVLLDGSGFLILWLGVSETESAVLNLYHGIFSAAVFVVEGVDVGYICKLIAVQSDCNDCNLR
jgi:hypothetical protein